MLCFSSALFFPAQTKAETPTLGKYEKTSEPITINADTLEYDRGKDIYLANGHVEIIQGKIRLTADEVIVDNKTGDISASGNVVFIDEEDRLTCESINLNMNTKVGVIHNGRLFIKKWKLPY